MLPEDLGPSALASALAEAGSALGHPLVVVAETGSTNDDAKAAARAGAPEGATFLADAQRRGRGRGGHAWHSPPGENLYLSVVVRPRLAPTRLAPVALVAGLAVARSLEGLFPPERAPGLEIKWPNDVLAGGSKLAGVLVEAALRGEAVESVVVGIGVNVRTLAFPPELRATSLARLGAPAPALRRARVAAFLLAELGRLLPRYAEEGLSPLAVELGRRDALLGRRIAVGDVEGEGAGIDGQGRLRIRTADGSLAAVASGSVRA